MGLDRQMTRKVLTAFVAMASFMVMLPIPGVLATSSTAGDAVPNFTESGECGESGLRGPMSQTNWIAERIYGPYADFFGRSKAQVLDEIVWWGHPFGKSFRVHQRSLPAFQAAAAGIVDSGTGYGATTGGGYNWRNIGGSRRMSHHAVGNAVDINPSRNPYSRGPLITNMPAEYVAAWTDAGFCWGGNWRFSKDSMHYTWRGPAASVGATSRLTPYAPLTSAAGFTQRALNIQVTVPPGAGLYAMSDRRGDGADDLYALVDIGGEWQVQAAGAASDFGVLGIRRQSSASTGGLPFLSDIDGDGKADLWNFEVSGATIAAQVYLDSTRFTSGPSVTTAATWSTDAELGMAVFGWDDWLPDLFVIRRDTGDVEVYSSSSGFQTLVHSSTLPVAIGGDQIVLADRGTPTDGTADIWLVGTGGSAAIRVIRYTDGGGYSGAVESVATSMSVPSGATVMPGDYDGDGRVDLYVLANADMSVWLGGVADRPSDRLSEWFTPDGPLTFDAGPVCEGVCDTMTYVDPGGKWRLAHRNEWGTEDSEFYFGDPGDEPFMGDWDCDGIDTPGLYRRSDGYVYLRNSNTQGVGDIRFFFGNPGDIPIPGDFNGDGCDTVSIYRPSQQAFFIINELGSDDAGLGAADFWFMFGNPGDKPFSGDFDGDGIDEVALHRESTGRVYFRFSLTTGIADRDFVFGDPGDLLVAGDWNGDGTDTPAIFRPSDGNWYLRLSNTQGIADHVLPFGLSDRGFKPVAGHTALAGH